MIRTFLAAAILAAAGASQAADAPQVAKPQCDPKPRAPGIGMRNDDFVMKRFNQDAKRYEDCMKAYVTEHQALAKANQDAAEAAADEYNKTIKQINDELKSD
ncbi:MAG TPA: hypothetical protein VLY46_14785 [Usitatibacter sp.]|nr:hypothetical protein [Usitatibacter sp.]